MALTFLPDGRMLIAQKEGVIRQLQPGSSILDPTPYMRLPDVYSVGERGLFSLVLDPDFATNGYFYVYYSKNSNRRHRISRFTQNGTLGDVTTEFVVWEDNETISGIGHIGGGMDIGPDGLIYLATGDENEGTQAQNLTRSGGKIIRVGRDGTVPATNPAFDGPGPNVDSIWAWGLRNPLRAHWDFPSNRFFVGDVGNDLFEEVHVAQSAANLGWPLCEGDCVDPRLYDPLHSYPHVAGGVDLGGSVIGGFVYRGVQFPAQYVGSYFYADFVRGSIKYLSFDAQGNVIGDLEFDPTIAPAEIVFLGEGPEGALYYIEHNAGTVRRIAYQASNQSPQINLAEADVTSGPGPTLTVQFTGAATDPDGDPLTYSWVFGDGDSDSGSQVTHTYTELGPYSAQLVVRDAAGNVSVSQPIDIAVGQPPQVSITSPIEGSLFQALDEILYSATATDPDGTLSEADYSWTIELTHEDHEHPESEQFGGSSGTFVVPISGHSFVDDTGFRFTVTVTDADQLSTSTSVTIVPDKVQLTFDTNPSGLEVVVDGRPLVTPVVLPTLKGFEVVVGAPLAQCAGPDQYDFASWSDGGTATHVVTAPGVDQVYIADYAAVGPCAIRVSSHLLALYTFNDGSGSTVADVSNNLPIIDLTIQDPASTSWLSGGGLSIPVANRVSSSGPATKINEAIEAANEFTVEAWIRTFDLDQDGPARIVTLSESSSSPANTMLGQGRWAGLPTDAIDFRVRSTSLNPSVTTPAGSLRAVLTHVLATRDATGLTQIYIDGGVAQSGTIAGELSNWDLSRPLHFANEADGTRPWLGELHLVAFYGRALDAAEVSRNYNAGPVRDSNLRPIAVFSADPISGMVPLAVAVDATASSDPDGTIVSYHWDFGDGSTGTGVSPSHTFVATGSYTVTLTVADDGGASSQTSTVITVEGPPTITTPPSNQAVEDSDSATFVVVAEGTAPLSFQWETFSDSDWIDIVGATSAQYATPPTTPGDDGSRFRCRVSNVHGTVQSAEALLIVSVTPPRVSDGLLALYTFAEDPASTTVVPDVSGVAPALDLDVLDPAAVISLPGGGLSVGASTRIQSPGAATKVNSAIRVSGEFTVEAWIRTASLGQDGPARIVTLSESPSLPANTMLGQGRWGSFPSDTIDLRVRSSSRDPSVTTPAGSLSFALSHVVATRDATGAVRIYLGGELAQSGSIAGDLSVWNDAHPLILANEADGSRPWFGELHLVAFYDRSLSSGEVQQNFGAGIVREVNQPPVASFFAQPSSGVAPLDVAFDAAASFDPEGAALSFDWDFGDGTGDTGVAPTHLYSVAGDYPVILTVTDDQGDTATDSLLVSVEGPPDILSEPADATVTEGDIAAFTVVAAGTAPLSYQWETLSDPDWIDIVGATSAQYSTPPTTLADDGTRLRCRVSNVHGIAHSAEALLTVSAATLRVTAGLLALYTFAEDPASTTVVPDVSGVAPALDLDVLDPAAVTWLPGGGLSVGTSTRIQSPGAATKVNSAIRGSGEFTVEAWIRTADLGQDGPARIVTLSESPSLSANTMLGQGRWGSFPSDTIDLRVRASSGDPSVTTPAGSLSLALSHVVATRNVAGAIEIYIDGDVARSGSIAGDLSVWNDAHPLVLANEADGSRPWFGELHLVAFYDRALGAGEVQQNFSAGIVRGVNQPPVASFFAQPSSGVAPLDVAFDAAASFDPEGAALSYDWDFGDGTGDTGVAPTHLYSVAGDYPVILTVTDDQGDTATDSLLVSVEGPPDILSEPADATVTEGDIAAFTVVAAGTAPLSYQWETFSDPDWVDIVGATSAQYSTPPTTLADDGTRLRCRVSNVHGAIHSAEALLAVSAATLRVTAGLLALYTFAENPASTTVVPDVSGVAPALDLDVLDPTAVTSLPGGGLSVGASTRIQSPGAATKVNAAIRESGEFTVEAWIRTADLGQDGPARIVTLSESPSLPANTMLGQGRWGSFPSDTIDLRVHASSRDPSVTTPAGSLSLALSHVVATRDVAGAVEIYIDGVVAPSGSIAGDLSVWNDAHPLILANEADGSRPWLGELHLVAFYDRALGAAEVQQNFSAGIMR